MSVELLEQYHKVTSQGFETYLQFRETIIHNNLDCLTPSEQAALRVGADAQQSWEAWSNALLSPQKCLNTTWNYGVYKLGRVAAASDDKLVLESLNNTPCESSPSNSLS